MNSAGITALSLKPPRITDEMYARIPALLGQGMTQTEIAAMCGVTPGTLKVLCSRRRISLRRRPRKLLLPVSDHVLKSLRRAARSRGKGSTERLISDLLEKIASDDLYNAVLDEEAPPPSEQVDPPGFLHSPPLTVNDQDGSITASATTASATKISA